MRFMIEKRKKIFEKFSENLRLVIERGGLPIEYDSPIYICPLCKGIFYLDDTFSNNDGSLLTVEHVPPKSVGYSCEILTCKMCNNDHGAILDSHFKREVSLKSIFAITPNRSLTSEFVIDERIPTRGNLNIDEEGEISFFFDGKRTNPKYEKEIIKRVQDPRKMKKLKMKFKTYNKKLASLSLIRAGYLILFNRFGYGFLFTKGAEKIRQIINNQNTKDEFPIVIPNEISDDLIGINVIIEPKELSSYLVGINVQDGNYSFNYGIIIPGAHDLDMDVYRFISKRIETKQNLDFEVVEPAAIDYLTDANNCLRPISNW